MSNEILLILSIFIIYGSVIVMYKLFGKQGLFCFTSIATIAANIEVLIMVKAFGMVMTLGNVLFASTFLITDIVSEVYGKKDAKRAVHIGITTSIVFIIFSQWWLLYTPDSTDFAMPAMQTIFSNTPRLMITSMVVYAIVQEFDVWAYHKWWDFTNKLCNIYSNKPCRYTICVLGKKNIKEDKRIRKRGTRLIWCCPLLIIQSLYR